MVAGDFDGDGSNDVAFSQSERWHTLDLDAEGGCIRDIDHAYSADGGLAILYGAATWRGMNGNTGRGVEGKMYVAAGAIGAMVIGLAPTIVRVLFDAGQAG